MLVSKTSNILKCCLSGCDAIESGITLTIFRRNMLPPSSGYTVDKVSMSLLNFGVILPDLTEPLSERIFLVVTTMRTSNLTSAFSLQTRSGKCFLLCNSPPAVLLAA
jgi:hypothetical protein